VRRVAGPGAGLLAGAVLASTPVAALMFRFDNPDALLVLVMTTAAYATVRAIERGSASWLVLAGGLLGVGFLTKMLQVMLVVPGLALAFLIAAHAPLRRRLCVLLAAGAALVVTAGWWVAVVELVPARYRPYIGGSQTNSVLELIFGYNGFGRLTGNETGSTGGMGGPGSGSQWGATGLTRMFGADFAGNISWLLPAAGVAVLAGLVSTRRAPRTDAVRASVVLWGGWLLVTWLCFSLMAGIIHPYYSVALAPAIGALVGITGTQLWQRARRRRGLLARSTLAAAVAGTAGWATHLLWAAGGAYRVLGWAVLIAGAAAGVAVLFLTLLSATIRAAVAGLAVAAVLSGPLAFTAQTVSARETGSIVSAGPSLGGGFDGMQMGRTGPPGMGNRSAPSPGSAAGSAGGPPSSTGQTGTNNSRSPLPGRTPVGGGAGGPGGLLGATPSATVAKKLSADASGYTWVAAAVGAQNAASYQLATGDPVMAIGGFNGSDPSPTLAQFKAYVAAGRIHYFIGSATIGGGAGGAGGAGSIATWVSTHFTATTVGGVTLYDLSSPKA